MKTIKYKTLHSLNDGKSIFYEVAVDWNEENEAIAATKSYNGEYEIEDDGIEPNSTTEDIMLRLLADHEERICMMELNSL